MMNYTFLPSYAKKYNCQLSRIRDSWKEYLKDNNLKPAQLLADGVHLNKHGEYLMAELIGQELVYRPEQPADEWKDTVRTLVVGKDIKWEGEHLVLEFEGNRVDAVAAAGADMMGWTVDVDLDDKKITDIPECYYHARPSGTAGVGWPAIQRIDWQKPLMLEEWTATFTGFNDDQTDFKFSLTGSKTGPDGEGSAKEKFVSKSGRVVIAPQDWVFAYCKKVSKKSTPEGFQVRWRVKPLFVGAYHVPKVTDPTVERCTTLVQGIANGKHKLVLCGRKAVIAALRVYRPPVKAAEEGAKQDKSGQ
jgi:hypothetical protein